MRRGPKALTKWQSCKPVKSRPLEALMGIIAMLESPKKQAATPTGSGLAPKGAMIYISSLSRPKRNASRQQLMIDALVFLSEPPLTP